MTVTDLQRIANFRVSFARRQAAGLTEVPGGVAVLDPEYAASHEHCDLVFLLADAGDWPQTWYARRGFNPIGHSHAFTRTEAIA
jgi:hypothetical protein